jgi:beta-lactamase regulating signal transducer with metallopeptidase domain
VIEAMLPILVGNLALAACLASVAYAVHRSGRDPRLAHLLWIVVLIRLLTPPLLVRSVPALPRFQPSVAQSPGDAAASVGSHAPGDPLAAWVSDVLLVHGPVALLLIWALGSLTILVVTLLRARRFDRVLRVTARDAPADWCDTAAELARQLGLRSVPRLAMTTARLSPLTWWAGGRVSIVVPEGLAPIIGAERIRWVLAHELVHVKRLDYLVRWLEWLACVTFWWNPLVWWVRRRLHFDEEASCDALVLERFAPEPRSYGQALLGVVEFLAGGRATSPILATGIDARGSLERRFAAIVSRRRPRTSRWLAAALMGTALVLLTLGLSAEDGSGIGADLTSSPMARLQLSGQAAPVAPDVAASPLGAGDILDAATIAGDERLGSASRDGFAMLRARLTGPLDATTAAGRRSTRDRRAEPTAIGSRHAMLRAERIGARVERTLLRLQHAADGVERSALEARLAALERRLAALRGRLAQRLTD